MEESRGGGRERQIQAEQKEVRESDDELMPLERKMVELGDALCWIDVLESCHVLVGSRGLNTKLCSAVTLTGQTAPALY